MGEANPDLKALRHYQSRLMPHKQKIIQLLDETMVFDGLPAVALITDPEKKEILLRNYRDTYLDQDIRNLVHYWGTKSKEKVDLVLHSPKRMIPGGIKSDKKIQARHLKGLKTFLHKEKEKIGILVGRFEEANIIEEGSTRIFLLPHWMV
ncbi:MAG: hypothetical protein L7F78_05595 [Syntrophales bacterium LBB04]|nr:hypothetical protein [Syntrophales bacterium LBB04]